MVLTLPVMQSLSQKVLVIYDDMCLVLKLFICLSLAATCCFWSTIICCTVLKNSNAVARLKVPWFFVQWALLTSVGFSIDKSIHLELNVYLFADNIGRWCPTCCPGESLNKTRRNCDVSDICVNHTTCAFSDHPFIMQYSCNKVLILFHIWK